jgi:hypothetical protein
VLREEGIDKTSRFTHSAAFQPTRRVLGIARSSIDGSNQLALQLLSKRELTQPRFLNTDTFLLCSTNSVATITDAESIEVMFFLEQRESEKPRQMSAKRVALSATRRLLIGCGESPWVLDGQSLAPVPDANATKALALLCTSLTSEPQSRVAASDDLRTVAMQEDSATPPSVTIVQFADTARTNHVILPDATFKLQKVQGKAGDVEIIFTGFSAAGREVVAIFDLKGRELWRRELSGIPVSDVACTRVVTLLPSQAMQLNQGENLSVKVWLPHQNRESILSLGTSDLLAELGSMRRR